jgi:hypothetical protein
VKGNQQLDGDTVGVKHMLYQWIGLREKLQETPIFHGKIHGL